jgi:type IV secretion system protein TrbL
MMSLMLLQLRLNPPTSILQQFQAVRQAWFVAVWPYAAVLFTALATIEFAWAAIVLMLQGADLQQWLGGMIRKVMWIGAFYALLIFGPTWIPAIIDSFSQLGQQAGQTGPLSPGAVFVRGMDIAGNLFLSAGIAGYLTHFGAALALDMAAIVTFLGFVGISIQFVVAVVESYVVVGAGLIFLGFGGSRWTAPYVERYIALAVSIGVKIFCLYLLVGLGMTLSGGWILAAVAVPNAPDPAMSAWEIAGASLILFCLCWMVPKFVAGLLGGSPALTGGDLVATTMMLGQGALAIGGLAAASVAAVAGAPAGVPVAAAAAIPPPPGGGGASPAGGGGTGGGSPNGGGGSGGFGPGVSGANVGAAGGASNPPVATGGFGASGQSSGRPGYVAPPANGMSNVFGGIHNAAQRVSRAASSIRIPDNGASSSAPGPKFGG